MRMNRLLELRHSLWVKVQLGVPPRLRPALQKAKETALLLFNPYLTTYRWEGGNQGGPLTVSYTGVEYAKPFLKSILFIEEPQERKTGRVPIWRAGRLAEPADTDISYVVANEGLIRKLPRQNALVLPFRTRLALDVRGEWEDVVGRFRRSARRHEVKKVQEYGYTCEESHRDREFEIFYHTMYLPTMKGRHADLATLLSFEEAYQYFKRGVLLLIQRDGRHVAGAVNYPEEGVLYGIIIGVLNGDEQLRKEAAMSAVYYWNIHWAHQHGYNALDFWGSKPYLSNLFLYKRKWGITVGVPSDMPQRIWLKVWRDTPAVQHFLEDNPCIILDDHGGLWGLIVTDDPGSVTPEMQATWHKQYDTPGLKGLLVRSVADLVQA